MTTTGEGTLALTILLDQIPRNIFRGSPRPFMEFDPLARQIVQEALTKKSCHTVHPFFRHFLYMVRMTFLYFFIFFLLFVHLPTLFLFRIESAC